MAKMGSESFVVVGTTSVQILPGNQRRVAIRISAPVAGNVTLSTRNPAVQFQGIVLQQGDPPQFLCPDCVGNLVESAWQAIADAPGRTIGFVEVIEIPDQRRG